jgi:eukaryotic-like serine/threonine-protein kinase
LITCLPFTGNDPLTIVSQHVHAPVVPPCVLRPDLPRALEAIIVRLLQKNPAERYATATETATVLRKSLVMTSAAGDSESVATIAILDALSRGGWLGAQPNSLKLANYGAAPARATAMLYF